MKKSIKPLWTDEVDFGDFSFYSKPLWTEEPLDDLKEAKMHAALAAAAEQASKTYASSLKKNNEPPEIGTVSDPTATEHAEQEHLRVKDGQKGHGQEGKKNNEPPSDPTEAEKAIVDGIKEVIAGLEREIEQKKDKDKQEVAWKLNQKMKKEEKKKNNKEEIQKKEEKRLNKNKKKKVSQQDKR